MSMPFVFQLLLILIVVVVIFGFAGYIINGLSIEPRSKSMANMLLGLLGLVVLVWVLFQVLGPAGGLNLGRGK